MNTVIMMGNLTRNPEMRYTQDGKAVASFSIAVRINENNTSFFEWSAWEKTAEFICEHFKKGNRILVEGRAVQDRWDDKDSGKTRSAVKFTAFRIHFTESKSAREKNEETHETRTTDDHPKAQPRTAIREAAANEVVGQEEEEDDVPF